MFIIEASLCFTECDTLFRFVVSLNLLRNKGIDDLTLFVLQRILRCGLSDNSNFQFAISACGPFQIVGSLDS